MIFKRELNINIFVKLEALGKGWLGKVYKVHDESTGNFFAAKISRLENYQLSKEIKLLFHTEIEIMDKVNHPTALKLYGHGPVNFNKKRLTFILELTKIDLDTILELERESNAPDGWYLTPKLIVIYGIASAMKYLHSLNIIHCDLKPANILLDEYLFPKVGDFGLSKILHRYNIDQSENDAKGTPSYMAPEIWCYCI